MNRWKQRSKKISFPSAATSSGTHTYTVEIIVGHRGQKGLGDNIEYEVKWKNYSDAENTWEPLRTLKDCPESIQEY